MDYRTAGVDIREGERLVRSISEIARSTSRKGVIGSIGGFAAMFDPKAAGFADPIILATTDGVGTKLKIAIESGKHDTVGIDLVAMCVNDLVVQGAQPLFFLDYFATGRLRVGIAKTVIQGIADGCKLAGCALIGGETAEMPGMYADADYDLAGFAVGAVERGKLLPNGIEAGDLLIGLGSSGIHSNGYSLVRAIVEKHPELSLSGPFPSEGYFGSSLADVLLTPTHIYTTALLKLHERGLLRGAAHITGGGIAGNLKRVIPSSHCAVVEGQWRVPPVFKWLREAGNVTNEEMERTFNCGIGMILVVRIPDVAETLTVLEELGEDAWILGTVQRRESDEGAIVTLPRDEWWQ